MTLTLVQSLSNLSSFLSPLPLFSSGRDSLPKNGVINSTISKKWERLKINDNAKIPRYSWLRLWGSWFESKCHQSLADLVVI